MLTANEKSIDVFQNSGGEFQKSAAGLIASFPVISVAKEPINLKRLGYLRKRIYTTVAEPEVFISTSDEPIPPENKEKLTYKRIKRGEVWSRVHGCAWFHVKGEIPDAAKGKRTVLCINIGGEGLVYDGVEPVCAISNAKALIDVFSSSHGKTVIDLVDCAAGREKLDIYMDCGFNGVFLSFPFGRGVYKYAKICTVNDEWNDLYYDYLTVTILASVTKDKKEHAYLDGKLTEAFRLARKDKLAAAKNALCEIMNGKPMEDFEITAVGHSHLDLAWLWPIRETKRKALRTFSNQLKNIKSFDGYVYGASQPWQFNYIKHTYPRQYEQIKQAVKNGLIEPQGAMWVEPDMNIPSGEALVRQLYYGKRFFRDEFGEEVKTCWLPDVFGYNGNLPQLLKRADIPYFMTIKLSWNEHNNFPFRSFNWYGIDNSAVLVHMPPDESYNSCGSPACARHTVENYPEKDIAKRALVVFGIGDGGGGPSDVHVELASRQKTLKGSPRLNFGKAVDFFDKLSEVADKLPNYKGELYLEKHQGTYTTQARNKRYNRRAEYALQDLECLAVYAYSKGCEYPQEMLDDWWREILLYQFHDIIPGSSITRVYEESRTRYEAILKEIEDKKREIMCFLTGEGACEAVFNPTSFSRKEIIDGRQVSVEPYSFAELQPIENTDELNATDNTLSNGLLTVRFDGNGEIASLQDNAGNEYSNGYLNRLKLFFDSPKFFNAWDINWKYHKHRGKTLKAERFEIFNKNGKVTRRNYYKHNKTTIFQEVSLTLGSDVVDIRTSCDFYELFKMLRAEFMPRVAFDKVTCDIQFGTIERSAKDITPQERAQFEVCAHKFVDVSDDKQGLSLMNDCKYGHRAKSGIVSLNLLRSPVFPDKKADRGHHEFAYSIYPHKGACTVETLKRSYALNKPLYVFRGCVLPAVAVGSNEDVVIDTIKKAYDRNAVVVRMYESRGKNAVASLRTAFDYSRAMEVNLMEEHEVPVDISKMEFLPFEIKTVMLELN